MFQTPYNQAFIVTREDGGVWWTMDTNLFQQSMVLARRGYDITDIMAELASTGQVVDQRKPAE